MYFWQSSLHLENHPLPLSLISLSFSHSAHPSTSHVLQRASGSLVPGSLDLGTRLSPLLLWEVTVPSASQDITAIFRSTRLTSYHACPLVTVPFPLKELLLALFLGYFPGSQAVRWLQCYLLCCYFCSAESNSWALSKLTVSMISPYLYEFPLQNHLLVCLQDFRDCFGLSSWVLVTGDGLWLWLQPIGLLLCLTMAVYWNHHVDSTLEIQILISQSECTTFSPDLLFSVNPISVPIDQTENFHAPSLCVPGVLGPHSLSSDIEQKA